MAKIIGRAMPEGQPGASALTAMLRCFTAVAGMLAAALLLDGLLSSCVPIEPFAMPTIALLVFPGVQALDVSGPLDVFAEANRFLLPPQHYRLSVIGSTRAAIACSNGLQIVPHLHYSDATEPYDLLLAAGGPELPQQPRDAALSEWLVQAAARATRYGAICNGVFLLARAGLLAGKRVTTHWNDAAALARDFPEVTVEADRLYLHDGPLVSSAGVSAGIDLSLALLAQEAGTEVALNVAKRLVVFMQRGGGQSQFSPYLTPHAEETSLVGQVQHYVREHLHDKLSVALLAKVVSCSARNFARVFARDAQMTPAEFIESARVDAARVMLERTQTPLKTIAYHCGFRDAGHMRMVFQRRLGISTQRYRDNFGEPSH